MAFQFMCPQGHVLQGDEAHAGQTIQCPQCGTTFIIPSPEPQSAPTAVSPPTADFESPEEDNVQIGRRRGRFGFLDEESESSGDDDDSSPADILTVGPRDAFDPSGENAAQRLVTIPCPNGHPLTTPYTTMGDSVLCPHCGEQFQLVYTDSLEHRRDVETKQAIRDHKLGKTWLTWAVVAAVLVVAIVLGLIISASQ
jgi:hypothetical protein